jgi:hypothetical protein
MHVCTVVSGKATVKASIARQVKRSFDERGEAFQTAYDRNQDVLKPTVLQLCHHREPEFGALVVSDPKTKNLAHAIPADTKSHLDGFVLDHATIHCPAGHCEVMSREGRHGF